MVTVTPSGAALGARVSDLDLNRLDDAMFAAVEAALHRHGVIALSDQHIDEDVLVAFSRRFGKLEINVTSAFQHPKHPELLILSNRTRDGKAVGLADAGQGWHADNSYNRLPGRASILYALEVPVRDGQVLGDTLFADMRVAYKALPDDVKQRIEGRLAVHDFAKFYDDMIKNKGSKRPPLTDTQRAARPPVQHPLVMRHPYTGDTCLYADPGYTTRILGLPEAESDQLLEFLFAHETRDAFIYRHKWRLHDILIWDNCSTIHMATGGYRPDEPRHMMRTQVQVDAARMQ
ncbi:MAG: TauD/TfdA family dioxygenase [Proteobacteria bacterium]|nr:TauD/TfdA family dioxygenase [Pseudomonadota bacterium]